MLHINSHKIKYFLFFLIAATQLSMAPSKAWSALFTFDGCGPCDCPFQNNCCDSCMNTYNGFTTFIPVLELDAVFGETVGVCEDYASIGTQMYTSFGPNPGFSFVTTFKAHLLNDHGSVSFASNIGLGFRTYEWQTGVTKGLHLFFDTREYRGHNYQAASLSLEYLTKCFSVRLNGYYPVGQIESSASHKTYEFPGGYIAKCTNKGVALKGADLSLELPLISAKCWDFSIIGGAYYFSNKCVKTEGGGLGIVRLTWNGILSLEGRYTNDREFGSRGQGVLSVNIPLMGGCNSSCESYTRQLVRRFDIIPIGECCCWKTNFNNPM